METTQVTTKDTKADTAEIQFKEIGKGSGGYAAEQMKDYGAYHASLIEITRRGISYEELIQIMIGSLTITENV